MLRFSFAALLKRQIIRRDFHAASRDLRKELNAFFVLEFASERELAFPAPETIAKVLRRAPRPLRRRSLANINSRLPRRAG